jgi:hypothetical protein
MLGKVMQGQTGALSRYGYAFDEAQEHILKTGTEAQRAAVLFDVVGEAVGGVNAALAATPEGKLKQWSNDMDDIRGRLGKIVTEIRSALLPLYEKFGETAEKATAFLERNREKLEAIASTVSNFLSGAINGLMQAITATANAVMWFVNGVREGNAMFVAAAVAVTGVTAAIVGYKVAVTAISVATAIWSAVQAGLNIVLTLNPVGLIVAGIVALIAVIAFLAIKIKGWGTLWEATVGFIKNITMAFAESIKLCFDTVVGGIMTAIDKIKLGWYQFKKAVGIGDEKENDAMISRIGADVEKRKQAIIDGASKVAEYSRAAAKSWEKVNLSWDNSVTVKGTVDKLKSQLGITDDSKIINNDLSASLSETSSSISSGGKTVKNFNITINDGLIRQVDNHFGSSSDSPESASDFMWRLSSALQMMLNDVNYAAE